RLRPPPPGDRPGRRPRRRRPGRHPGPRDRTGAGGPQRWPQPGRAQRRRGGIVLDLSAMRALDIDTKARTAWAEPGLAPGEYTGGAARHGLATGFGDTGSVGIGGITLAGGIGYLVRTHGLTIDQLLAAELVTADSQLLRGDAQSHPELFGGRPG